MSCQSQRKSEIRYSGDAYNANVVIKIDEMLQHKVLIFIQSTDQCCDIHNGQLWNICNSITIKGYVFIIESDFLNTITVNYLLIYVLLITAYTS